MKPFKYKVGDNIVNIFNWKCYIEKRYRNKRGTNCYLVSSNEDEDIDEGNGIEPGENWELKEYEIRMF